MLYGAIEEEVSASIAHYLSNVHYGLSVSDICESYRLDVGIEDLPLAQPVVPDLGMSVNAAAFHSVGPVNVGMHQGQDGVDVAGVEGSISSLDEFPVVLDGLLVAHGEFPFVVSHPSRLRSREG